MIYVMSDIHGNSKRFESVMKQINLQQSDTLYVLGDVIDRFPDGIRILRKLMSMPNVKMLIGNHEYMMLNSLPILASEPSPEEEYILLYNRKLWYRNGGDVTHEYIKHIRKTLRKEIFDYLKALPLNYDITLNGTHYKMAHGAPIDLFPLWGRGYKDETEFTVWERIMSYDETPKDYTLIFGHTPTIHFQKSNPARIWYGQNRVCIDCGCGYSNERGQVFRLACLRLDDGKEFYSED